MMPTLLLLIGLSSSVNLGEAPPGLVGQVVIYGARWQAQTTIDTTAKSTGAGWIAGQSVDTVVGPGLLIGGELRYRDGGTWVKRTGWVRAGYVRAWGQNVLHLVGRAALIGDTLQEGGAQIEYRRYAGRWVLTTTQGVLVYQQPTPRVGYAMTAMIGRVF